MFKSKCLCILALYAPTALNLAREILWEHSSGRMRQPEGLGGRKVFRSKECLNDFGRDYLHSSSDSARSALHRWNVLTVCKQPDRLVLGFALEAGY